MTLYSFSSSQQKWLTDSLFNYTTKKPLFDPTHIFYFVDRHTNTDGVFFLKKDTKGFHYIFNSTNSINLKIQIHPEQKAAEMIRYVDSKELPLLPPEVFENLQRIILVCRG